MKNRGIERIVQKIKDNGLNGFYVRGISKDTFEMLYNEFEELGFGTCNDVDDWTCGCSFAVRLQTREFGILGDNGTFMLVPFNESEFLSEVNG